MKICYKVLIFKTEIGLEKTSNIDKSFVIK